MARGPDTADVTRTRLHALAPLDPAVSAGLVQPTLGRPAGDGHRPTAGSSGPVTGWTPHRDAAPDPHDGLATGPLGNPRTPATPPVRDGSPEVPRRAPPDLLPASDPRPSPERSPAADRRPPPAGQGRTRVTAPVAAADDTDLRRDAADLRGRWSQDALGHARDAYVERHGSPLGRPELVDVPRRRWSVTVRLGLVAGVAVLLVAGAVGLRAAWPAPASAVDLPDVLGAPAGGGTETASSPSTDQGATGEPVVPGPGGEVTGGPVVHVVGQVTHPGLLELTAGARVADAIDAAGGPLATADLSALNLARTLTDGEQVVVPAVGDPPADSTGTPDPGDGLVDLNRASVTELDALSGIGPVLADRIVAWRDEHGTFTSIEELTEVEGIGPALLERLRPAVRV